MLQRKVTTNGANDPKNPMPHTPNTYPHAVSSHPNFIEAYVSPLVRVNNQQLENSGDRNFRGRDR
jgi:hypothetical protein